MKHDINQLPEGKALPKTFEGPLGVEEPIHLVQGMISDEAKEVVYKALCKSGRYVDIPESALRDLKAEAEAEAAKKKAEEETAPAQ